MLEATVVLELALGKYVEASIIAGLLAFNAVLGFFQEGRACRAEVEARAERLSPPRQCLENHTRCWTGAW